jgi:hypothetical protein
VVYAQLTLRSNHRLLSGIPKGCLTQVIHARLLNVSFLIARQAGTMATKALSESRCYASQLRVPGTPSGCSALGGRDPVVYAQLTLCSNHRLISGIPKGCLTQVIHARLANVSFLIAHSSEARAQSGFLALLERSRAEAPILRGKESRCYVSQLRVPGIPSGCSALGGRGPVVDRSEYHRSPSPGKLGARCSPRSQSLLS